MKQKSTHRQIRRFEFRTPNARAILDAALDNTLAKAVAKGIEPFIKK